MSRVETLGMNLFSYGGLVALNIWQSLAPLSLSLSVCVCMCVCMYVCVCMCLCVSVCMCASRVMDRAGTPFVFANL